MSLIWKTSFVNSLKALMIGFPLQPLFCYGLECGKLTTLPRQAGEATQHGCLRRSPAPCKCLFLRGRESSWGLFTWNNTGSGLRNQHKTSGSDGHVLLKLHLFTEPVWPLHSGSLNTLHLYSLSSPSGSGLLTGVLEIPVNLQRCWVSEKSISSTLFSPQNTFYRWRGISLCHLLSMFQLQLEPLTRWGEMVMERDRVPRLYFASFGLETRWARSCLTHVGMLEQEGPIRKTQSRSFSTQR